TYTVPTAPNADVRTDPTATTGGDHGILIENLRASGNVNHYIVRTDSSPAQNAQPGTTVKINTGSYGTPLTAYVAACRTTDNTYCSDEQNVGAAVPIATRASAKDPTQGGTIAITAPNNAPAAQGYTTDVSYKITICRGLLDLCDTNGDDGPYQEGSTIPANANRIKVTTSVTITGPGGSSTTFTDDGKDQDVASNAPAGN
ncbi:MAG: hypothetical protein INR72_18940, partial [Williamsia herbipolensis]|nr:hypothetical protein [Williamsia herbipolensis]